MRLVLTILAAVLLLSLPASAAPQPLGSWTGGGQHSPWIEQQQITATTPTNPFGGECLWSVNDHELWTTFGYLDAGISVGRSKCVVADHGLVAPYGFSTAAVYAKSPDLSVSVCFSQGRCFSPSPVYVSSSRQYRWTFCGKVHYDPDDPALVEIPDSFGGLGEVSTVTTTITNTTDRRLRDIVARVGYASDIAVFMGWVDAEGCLPTIPYVDHFEYPYRWTQS